jgi:hypothetical protein
MKFKDLLGVVLAPTKAASGVRAILISGGTLLIAVGTLDPMNIADSAQVFITTVGAALGVGGVVAGQKSAAEKEELKARVDRQSEILVDQDKAIKEYEKLRRY